MTSTVQDTGPNLLLDWGEAAEPRRWLRAGVGSVVVHLIIFAFVLFVGTLQTPDVRVDAEITSDFRKVTPLYAPRFELTQKEPNKGKVSKEVNVEGLMERPSQRPTPSTPPVRAFKPPEPQPLPGDPVVPKLAEPPKIEAAMNGTPAVNPPAGVPKASTPPQIQSEEKPKLVLENPGQHGNVTSPTNAKLVPPKTSIEDTIHSVARGGGQAGVVVEEIEPPPQIPGTVRMPPSEAASRGRLELLSDPMGVDFRPYLTRIMALVRQNWFSVIPESARLGLRGTTQLQFIISRNGQVPKLVIATTSGSDPLDRAAVAGVSATVPFPPLPQDFKGQEIRVQFSFKYNIR